MKKLLITLFAVISIGINAQTPHKEYGPMWLFYQTAPGVVDSVKIYFEGQNAILNTTKQGFNFKDPIMVNLDTVATMNNIRGFVYLSDSTKKWTSVKQLVDSLSAMRTKVNLKQNTLVSGTNIKTVNGTTLLGTGDLTISSLTPTDNIFDWDGTNNWYAPYSSKQASMSFYTGIGDPTLTTRLNLDAEIHTTILYTNSPSNLSSYFKSATATVTEMRQEGSSATANTLFKINRFISGTGNVTGNIIDISDNPTTSGTISGKILSATIGSTERISLNPRVADGASAVAYFEDTHYNLTTAGAKLRSWRNQGTEKAFIDKDGGFFNNTIGIKEYSSSLGLYISGTPMIRMDASSLYSTGGNRTFYISRGTGTPNVVYSFYASTNTGLGQENANEASLYANGTEKVKVTTTNVQIQGTTDIEVTTASQGIILKSPDGTRYKVTVANGGTLTVTAL